jgi:erythromycin esterase-like protein
MPRFADLVQPLTGAAGDYDALMDRIGEARIVLLGEASTAPTRWCSIS